MRSLCLILLAWGAIASEAFAEPPAVPPPVELLLEGRAIESPALKYRLYPAENERHDGNAAPILLRLPWDQLHWMNKIVPTLPEWEQRPLTAPEWATFEKDYIFPDRFYLEIKRAAYRREAQWEYPIHETSFPHLILLNDVQGLRSFLNYGLSARVRYHLSRGEFDLAREGILVGISNAKHVAQTPFYITQQVAVSFHNSMLKLTREMITQPNSPNMYWAISNLPESLIEFDQATRLQMFEIAFPAVRDLDRPRTPEEWKEMAHQLVSFLIEFEYLKSADKSVDETLKRSYFTVYSKTARADLTARQGIPAEKVAAMSDEEAGLRWYTQLHLNLDQKTSAICTLRPREARHAYRRLLAEAQAMQDATGIRFWPNVSPVEAYVSAWSLKRRVASLRVVEAVRHYMGTHDGKLPASLDDIQDLTIPVDPLTDQPFLWQFEGETATLKSPPIPEEFAATSAATTIGIDYRIRVRSKAP